MTVVPANYDDRLAWRGRIHAHNAQDAALALFERKDPQALDDAVGLICPDRHPTPQTFNAIADAWEQHRHLRHQPRD